MEKMFKVAIDEYLYEIIGMTTQQCILYFYEQKEFYFYFLFDKSFWAQNSWSKVGGMV